MNIEEFCTFCLSLKGAEECLPFDNNTLVFKVMGKIFALADIEEFESIHLKCEPEQALLLREQYPSITAGYHMNKKHWNTLRTRNAELNDEQLKYWILHSYELIVSKLSKAEKAILHEL